MERHYSKNVCLYCLTDCDLFAKQYYITDENQKYQNMVKEIFNIQICWSKPYNNIICVKCSEDIKLAHETRRKIVFAQSILLERYEDKSNIDTDTLKQEIIISEDEFKYEDSKCDEISSDCGYDNDETSKTKVEESEDSDSGEKALKREIEPKDTHELNSQKKRRKPANQILKKESNTKQKTAHVVAKKVDNSTEKAKQNIDPDQKTSEESLAYSKNLESMKLNSIKLLVNSNMMMFQSRRTSFACFSCKKSYLDIKQLRGHMKTHSIVEITKRNILRIRGQTYKNVDISNLICTKCSKPCTNLDVLRDHLTSVHNEIFEDTDHLFIPFRLEDGFICVICQKSFLTFCKLSIHMHSHSTNNVCEICGSAFTNIINLRAHITHLHTTHKCPECDLTFPNRAARSKHLTNDHNHARTYKSRCLKCDKTFQYPYQVRDHMVEKHGAKRETCHCEQCGKKFPSLTAVKIHVRAVHIGERRYQCSLCEMRFFTSCDKRRHERTHRDEKTFSCDFCEVKFKSTDSVRRHVKRQHSVTNVN